MNRMYFLFILNRLLGSNLFLLFICFITEIYIHVSWDRIIFFCSDTCIPLSLTRIDIFSRAFPFNLSINSYTDRLVKTKISWDAIAQNTIGNTCSLAIESFRVNCSWPILPPEISWFLMLHCFDDVTWVLFSYLNALVWWLSLITIFDSTECPYNSLPKQGHFKEWNEVLVLNKLEEEI